jgi:hypothetical protein
MNTTQGLNLMDTIEDDQYSQQPNGWNRQRLVNAVQQLPMVDNSNLIGSGAGSQGQALGMMNTPGVGMQQLQHGLIGRVVGGLKGQAMGNLENTASGGSIGAAQNWVNQNTGGQQQSNTPPRYNPPSSQHLGDDMGDGYYKLNNNYFNQGGQ